MVFLHILDPHTLEVVAEVVAEGEGEAVEGVHKPDMSDNLDVILVELASENVVLESAGPAAVEVEVVDDVLLTLVIGQITGDERHG